MSSAISVFSVLSVLSVLSALLEAFEPQAAISVTASESKVRVKTDFFIIYESFKYKLFNCLIV